MRDETNSTSRVQKNLISKTEVVNLTQYVSNMMRGAKRLVLIHDTDLDEKLEMAITVMKAQEPNTAILVLPPIGDYEPPKQTKKDD